MAGTQAPFLSQEKCVEQEKQKKTKKGNIKGV